MEKDSYVLGISRHHDSAASITYNGKIIAAAEEERFNRKKHYGEFPTLAIQYCLNEAGITLGDIDVVAYFWQRWAEVINGVKHFFRYFPGTLAALKRDNNQSIVETIQKDGVQEHYDDYNVGGALLLHLFRTFTLGKTLTRALDYKGSTKFKVELVDHHLAHAYSTFIPSPFEEAAIMTIDGIGSDGTCTQLAIGQGTKIKTIRKVKYPHSLGAFYSVITEYLGFYPSSDEYKVMGFAPFGDDRYVNDFKQLIKLQPEGEYEFDLSWFSHQYTGKHRVSQKFIDVFGPPRERGSKAVEPHYAGIAFAAQKTLEETCLHMAKWLAKKTGLTNLCLAGGVALNCVMNGRLLDETPFDNFFAGPAAADGGTALGSALLVNSKRTKTRTNGNYIYLGPGFDDQAIENALKEKKVTYAKKADIAAFTAQRLADGYVVGWFQGRMEYGPRALGNRSIVADPRDPGMQDRLNEKVKHREPFRPFAPSVLVENVGDFFERTHPSPVMLLVSQVLDDRKKDIPAITHIDGTARVQTVSKDINPMYWSLIKHFESLTGIPLVVNTSFNDNNEPIVCTPQDAINCYLNTDIDGLAIGSFWLEKNDS
jgi:carbamoyltransferase